MNLSKELLSTEIPYLTPNQTGESVLSLMEEYKVGYLPLLEKGKYLCLVSERDAYRLEEMHTPIGKAWYFAPSVRISGSLLDALQKMTSNNICILPVVDEENNYLGAITQKKLLDAVAKYLGSEKEGSIIILEMLPQDFVLSEIARIVESNNSQIININSYPADFGNLNIAIKIDVEDLEPISRSFERFNFHIKAIFSRQAIVDDIAQKRLEELFYYINM